MGINNGEKLWNHTEEHYGKGEGGERNAWNNDKRERGGNKSRRVAGKKKEGKNEEEGVNRGKTDGNYVQIGGKDRS